DEALLTPDLMRLTRWMADYYLCGWGQVLNAVIPAGAKQQAGTRAMSFLEAVPEPELSQSVPSLPAEQAAALEQLRKAGKPIEARKLARLAQCGPGPIEALIAKGLARRVTRRIDKFQSSDQPEAQAREAAPITLNTDQLQAWSVIEQAIQNGGFQAMLLYGVT